ncbi:ATP synthase [Pavlovales sp. CCMP2436]|nr:ATP synthase [Pavlovales sp. CCMP2436]
MFRSVLMRAARGALRADVAAPSDPAFATKLKFNFSIPSTPLYTGAPVRMVIIPGAAGVFGVLKDHVPTIAAMKPGVVQIQENEGETELKQFFVSGGFAFVKPDSTVDVQAVEAVKLEDLDVEAVKKGVASFTALVASTTGEKAKAEAEIGLEVYQAMAAALGV